ncbi:ABC transporter ATP-binding protein [Methanoregula sp.]|uniref:ABC transporter ATP-binding protein n=1 Tax=Methanoregula sp. TaxID=2052170 RepID=UPI0025D93A39|nr:ABC transporter ATP-binding protein [Methanoregula sp.]
MTLIINDVSRVFTSEKGETIEALSHISFEVKDEEFICILGPSGCGKTTVLRIIAGLESASAGSVSVDGVPVTSPSPKMAMIFQEYSLYPWRTVEENVALGLELKGMKKPNRMAVAKKYLDLVGLIGFEHSYPYELSGGMRQRVAVARALAIDPSILLMDEPFGALDAQTRNRMQHELLRIWEKTKKTILFVTHSVDEAVFLADRIVVLTQRPGSIKEIVTIPSVRPRERTSDEFGQIRRHLLDMIKEESDLIQ